MRLKVNGESVQLATGDTLHALLEQLGKLEQRGMAVAVNGSVVTAGLWAEHRLSEDDTVLIIQATQGG